MERGADVGVAVGVADGSPSCEPFVGDGVTEGVLVGGGVSPGRKVFVGDGVPLSPGCGVSPGRNVFVGDGVTEVTVSVVVIPGVVVCVGGSVGSVPPPASSVGVVGAVATAVVGDGKACCVPDVAVGVVSPPLPPGVLVVSGASTVTPPAIPEGVNVTRAIGLGETIFVAARYHTSCTGAPLPQPMGPRHDCHLPSTVTVSPAGHSGWIRCS